MEELQDTGAAICLGTELHLSCVIAQERTWGTEHDLLESVNNISIDDALLQ